MHNPYFFRLFFIVLTVFSFQVKAQQFDWATNIGATGNDYGRDVAVDRSGNVYTTGFFSGTVDFDPGSGTHNLSSAGGFDVFVLKTNASGNFLWAKSIGSTATDAAYTLDTDGSGNVYIAGRFEGTVDFDPGTGTSNHTAAGSYDFFVQKLDSAGNFVWAATMGGTSTEQPSSIAVDSAGNVYTSGTFQGTADFDPGNGTLNLTSAGVDDIFLVKLNASGSLAWAKSIGSTAADRGYSLTRDAAGNIYATGIFSGTVDFDPNAGTHNLTSAGNFDFFVLKLDASGNFLWANNAGGTSFDFAWDITTDKWGAVYTAGYFQGTADFDPGSGTQNITSAGNYDIFVQKQDSSGNFIWVKTAGGAGDDRGYSIKTDDSAQLYITGYFQQTADFDPGQGMYNIAVAGLSDFYLMKLDTAGDFIYAAGLGGSGSDFGLNLTLDKERSIYITGNYDGTADFDPDTNATYNITSAGGSDGFLMKIKQCVSYSSISVAACDTYTSPSGNYTWTVSGNFTDTLTNAAGCDSVVFIGLTIKLSKTTNLTAAICQGDSILLGGSFQTAGGTYYDTLKTTGGCDSVLLTDLKINPVTTTTQSLAICQGDSILLAGTYQKTAAVYYDTLQSALGCDSILASTLTVNPVQLTARNVAICQGDSVLLGGAFRHNPGNYSDTFTATSGCDSIINTALVVNPVHSFSRQVNICKGDSFFVAGNYQSNPGIFYDTLSSATGCDSVITTVLDTFPDYIIPLNMFICQGDSIFLQGSYQKTAGSYSDTLSSSTGCDSILVVQLIVNPVQTQFILEAICRGDSILLAGIYRYTAGTYTDTLKTVFGCDSIIITSLNVNSADTSVNQTGNTLTANVSGASYRWLDCTNAFAPIPGETAQSFTPSLNGSYAVEVSENGCVDTSFCRFVQVVSISEKPHPLNLKVYPNPTSSKVTLQFESLQQNIQVVILALDGKTISTKSFTSGNTVQMDLGTLPAGIYFLRISTNEGVTLRKLMKE